MLAYFVPVELDTDLTGDDIPRGWAYVEAENPQAACDAFDALPCGAILHAYITENRDTLVGVAGDHHWHRIGPVEWVKETESYPKAAGSDAAW